MMSAARDLFIDRGYAGTRMNDIAERAGVAVQTLYFTFHSKPELIRACQEFFVFGPEGLPPPMQPWYRAAMAATTPAEAIHHFSDGNGSILDRVGLLDEAMRAARHEPQVASLHDETERLRRGGYQEIAEHMASVGMRTAVDEACDVMMAVAGPGLYRAFIVDAGWSHQRYVKWLETALVRILLG